MHLETLCSNSVTLGDTEKPVQSHTVRRILRQALAMKTCSSHFPTPAGQGKAKKPPILGLGFLPRSLTQHICLHHWFLGTQKAQAELTTEDIF